MSRWWNGHGREGRDVCPLEAEVVASLRRGRADAAVEAHLVECGTCREVADTLRAMLRIAESTEALAERQRLPGAGQLWWKGQLARRWEAEERALAPLDMMQRLEVVIGAVAAVVLLVLLLRSLAGRALIPSTFDLWSALAGVAGTTSFPLLLGAALAAMTAALVVHRLVLRSR
ncbi:MAG TPA: hypothetical protein VIL35_14520 [Vicinamibacterales bacterium]